MAALSLPGLRRLLLLAGASLAPSFASAHAGGGSPAAWDLAWSFEPWVVALMLASAAGYARGLTTLWRRAGVGRGVSPAQALAFAGGWFALGMALVSPLDRLGVRLFSAHMLQHELMMVVAAPLMCLARPLALWTWAMPVSWRRRVGGWTRARGFSALWRGITGPLAAWSLHALALWGWHAPRLFEAALHDEGIHTLQHLGFLGTALLFWWSVLRPSARSTQGLALASLFTTLMHTGALGALLTLSDQLWYPSYQASAGALGLDPLEDQQLGGLVMWVPAGVVYVVAGLGLAVRVASLSSRDAPSLRSSHTESPNSWVR